MNSPINKNCSQCGKELTFLNTYACQIKVGSYVCKDCHKKRVKRIKQIQQKYLSTHKNFIGEQMSYPKAKVIYPQIEDNILKIKQEDLRLPSTSPSLRADGCFKDMGYILNPAYNWQIVLDDKERPTLICTVK